MLKPYVGAASYAYDAQPPLGGCVLKLIRAPQCLLIWLPAAFRRLCVETSISRLYGAVLLDTQPPLGGCVLKHPPRLIFNLTGVTSRL